MRRPQTSDPAGNGHPNSPPGVRAARAAAGRRRCVLAACLSLLAHGAGGALLQRFAAPAPALPELRVALEIDSRPAIARESRGERQPAASAAVQPPAARAARDRKAVASPIPVRKPLEARSDSRVDRAPTPPRRARSAALTAAQRPAGRPHGASRRPPDAQMAADATMPAAPAGRGQRAKAAAPTDADRRSAPPPPATASESEATAGDAAAPASFSKPTPPPTPPATRSSAAASARGARGLTRTAAPTAGNPKPEYPRLARRRGYEGRVELLVTILDDGRVGAVEVRDGSGHAVLDRAAVDAVRRWRFVPALEEGRAIASTLTVPVAFRLIDP